MWKLANATPIFKKGDKQLIKNYRPISLLEKIIFNNHYTYLHTNNLITKKQLGFRPGDSTTNQLLYLLDEIHQAFDSTKSFEVRTEFLDGSKALDKVWHDGFIFKLEQNGISGNLLKLVQNYLINRKQRVASQKLLESIKLEVDSKKMGQQLWLAQSKMCANLSD